MPAKKLTAVKKSEPKVTKESKVEAKIATPKVVANSEKPLAAKKSGSLSITVYSLAGVAGGSLDLPKEVFGAEINDKLLSQALRVYMNNQKSHNSNTKTRGEVQGSTRKIYKQKGTGKARHGGIRAPIFVGGGIALGPKSRKVVLELPKKMKKAALISAFSQKAKNSEILAVSGLEKAVGKTKEFAKFLKKLDKKSALFIVDKEEVMTKRAIGNLSNVNILSIKELNAYEVLSNKNIFITKEAVGLLGGAK